MALILLHDALPFRFPDALPDHMLGSLGRDASEVLGLQRDLNDVAHSGSLVVLGSLGLEDLIGGVLDLLYNGLAHRYIEASGLGVDLHHIVLSAVLVPLDGDGDGGFDLFDQVLHGDALFLFQHRQCFKKFLIHFSQFLLLF